MNETSGVFVPLFAGEVPVENTHSTLETYVPRDEYETYAKDLARDFVSTEVVPAGLLLVGTAGNGKSHLAIGIGREIVVRGGRAAFITFNGSSINLDAIPDPPNCIGGWHDALDTLVDSFDVVIVDDVPGTMMPGPRQQLQRLMMESFDRGKKMIITSNRPALEVVSQIAEPPESGSSRTDRAIAVAERMIQSWQTIEFAGESYRVTRPKWWRGVDRPVTMPRSIDQFTYDIRDGAAFSRLLGGAILRIAEATDASGPEIAELSRLLARVKEGKQ